MRFSAARLRAARRQAGLTLTQLANGIDRSVYTIVRYEAGRIMPSVTALGRIADVLGQPVDAFFVDDARQNDGAA